MPLARFEARFLCECAESIPLAVGQNGCHNFGKGVKCCLHLGFPQHFYGSAEGVNCCLHVLVLQRFSVSGGVSDC